MNQGQYPYRFAVGFVHKATETPESVDSASNDNVFMKYVQIDDEDDGDRFLLPAALEVEEGANNGRQFGEDLTQDMIAGVFDSAVDYGAAQGVDAEELDLLRKTGVRIEHLGGDLLVQISGLTVTLDDDATGYGWSDSADEVDIREIDLLSAPTHEFGHVLGYDHDPMGDTLAVGERDLPLEDEVALVEGDSPFEPDLDSDVLVG